MCRTKGAKGKRLLPIDDQLLKPVERLYRAGHTRLQVAAEFANFVAEMLALARFADQS